MSLTLKIAVLILLSSCVTTPQSLVVERSKEQRPAWIELDEDKSLAGDALIQFHGVSTREPDLPLGIKRTQSQALAGSETGLLGIVRENIEQTLVKHKSSVAMVKHPEAETAIVEAVKLSHGTHAKVTDIYYERHQVVAPSASLPETEANAEFFMIHVLIQYPRSQISPVLGDIGRRLQRSRNPEVKRFGQTLLTPDI